MAPPPGAGPGVVRVFTVVSVQVFCLDHALNMTLGCGRETSVKKTGRSREQRTTLTGQGIPALT